jgi:hypothetical protein
MVTRLGSLTHSTTQLLILLRNAGDDHKFEIHADY